MTGMIPILSYYYDSGYGHQGGLSPAYWLILIGTFVASLIVSSTMRSRFTEFSRIPTAWTGAETARRMLHQHGISDVTITCVPGELTDHYDPTRKTVNLSESVYNQASLAAMAVAAHECGHAVQHHQAYAWLGLRTMMVPAVQFSASALNFLMMLGFFGVYLFHSHTFLWIWALLFGVTTLFSVVTLPVEFDASRRALAWLGSSHQTGTENHGRARSALFWAAMTYVVAALGSVAQLLYILSLATGGNRRD